MPLSRRRFIRTAAGASLAALKLPRAARAASRGAGGANVLLIMVDDMNTDLGCYGDPRVKSPHLDGLAAQGVRFDRAYCQYPWCSPSRSSLLTGLRPDKTRIFDLTGHFRKTLPDVVTLPQRFKAAGFYAARVGKIYHIGNPDGMGTGGLDDPLSWDEVRNPLGRDRQLEPRLTNLTPWKHGWGETVAFLGDRETPEADFTDGKVAAETIRMLEKVGDRPFFVAAGFFRPHCPFIAPQAYFDLYSPDSMPREILPENYAATVPAPALASTRPWPNFQLNAEQLALARRANCAAISFVDAQIGKVLAALDRLDLRRSTTVVFCSDHGVHRGDHGLWFKQTCFEQAARVPLIIAPAGGGLAAGQPALHPVELVDLYPTLAALGGLTPPAGLDGANLAPLLKDPAARWDRPAYTQVARRGFSGRSVRTRRWRYTEWEEGQRGSELYDHESDPQEMVNLAGDPRQRDAVARLRSCLRRRDSAGPVI